MPTELYDQARCVVKGVKCDVSVQPNTTASGALRKRLWKRPETKQLSVQEKKGLIGPVVMKTPDTLSWGSLKGIYVSS